MDLVFIYLSITLFVFVHVLTVRSPLPPTGLTPALACDRPPAPQPLGSAFALGSAVGIESQEGHAVRNVHFGTGSPVKMRLLAPRPVTRCLGSSVSHTSVLTPNSRDEIKGVGLLVSQMGTVSLSCCPFGSQAGVDHLAVAQVVGVGLSH